MAGCYDFVFMSEAPADSPGDHPDKAVWNHWYETLGRRVIATRNHSFGYEVSGDEDHALVLKLAGFDAQPRSVLEIGCGDGRVLSWFASSGADVIGSDVCDSALVVFRQALSAASRRGSHRLLDGGVEQLADLPSGSIDLVFSIFTLQHVSRHEEVVEYVRESIRLMSSRGAVVLQLRKAGPRTLVFQTLVDLFRLPTAMPSFNKHWRGHRFTKTEIEGMLQAVRPISQKVVATNYHYWLVLRLL